MNSPLHIFLATLAVSGPTFCWVLAGVVARRIGLLGEHLVDTLSRFAFTWALPLLLFASTAQLELHELGDINHLLAGIVATLGTIVLAWFYGIGRGFPREHLGIFVQGAYRSNLAIVGIALCVAAYGDMGLRLAALPIAVWTALYNVLAVLLLNATLDASRSVAGLLSGMARNPLIIGIAAGLIVALLQLPLPAVVLISADLVSTYFLPVALLCIGGAMKVSVLRSAAAIIWEAALWRLCIGPVLGVAVGMAMGVDGPALGVLFLLLASPVASASFVMVVAAGGSGALAANIVLLTTLLSALTVTAGFFVLSLAGVLTPAS